jgi:hypothetical protein
MCPVLDFDAWSLRVLKAFESVLQVWQGCTVIKIQFCFDGGLPPVFHQLSVDWTQLFC